MDHKTIRDAVAGNERIREKLLALVNGLPAEIGSYRADEKSWTIREIMEHLCLVEASMVRIISKLISKAEAAGIENDGSLRISASFAESSLSAGEKKFEAPESVAPAGQSELKESIENLAENRRALIALQGKLESVGIGDFTFPHPAFGNLNAHDWLVLIGGHEGRHIRQIKGILEKAAI